MVVTCPGDKFRSGHDKYGLSSHFCDFFDGFTTSKTWISISSNTFPKSPNRFDSGVFVKKNVTKIIIPPACVMKLLSDGKGCPEVAWMNACRKKFKLGFVTSALQRSMWCWLDFTSVASGPIRCDAQNRRNTRSELSHLIGPDATLKKFKHTTSRHLQGRHDEPGFESFVTRIHPCCSRTS